MTKQHLNERAHIAVDRALSTDSRERLAVRADFSAQVLRSAANTPPSARRAGIPVIALVVASVLTASTAIAGIVQLVRYEAVLETVACPECPVETQYLLGFEDTPLTRPGVDSAPAQTAHGVLFTEDLRISGANHNFFGLRVSASGMVSAMEGGGGLLRVYSPTGHEVAAIDPPLSQGSSRLYWGWVGELVWVFDTRELVQHVVAISPTPHVVSSRAVPLETPGPPGTTPHVQPVTGAAGGAGIASGRQGAAVGVAAGPLAYPRIEAVYPDGGLLRSQRFPAVEARMALGRLDLNDEDIPKGFLVRTGSDDRFVSFAPNHPPDWSDQCDRISPEPGLYGLIKLGIPWCEAKQMGVSPDGLRAAYSIGESRVGDTTTVRVAQVMIGGDTVFSRQYRIPSIRITKAQSDSIYEKLVTSATSLAEPRLSAFRDSILQNEMPTHRQPLDAITVGNDGSVLLHLFLPTPDRRYLLLDPRGEPVGTFALPRGVLALEVNGNTIWGVATQPDKTKDLVRYTIKP